MPSSLIFLNLKPQNLEMVLGLLYQNGVGALEEARVGRQLQLRFQPPGDSPARSFIRRLKTLQQSLPRPIITRIEAKIIKDNSWKKAYQKWLKPFKFPTYPPGRPALWIDPISPYPKRPKKNTLIIHGQMAFGTGHHPSTRLAGHLMQKALVRASPEAMMDLGCGTGILTMVAHRLGLKDIWAVEIDPEAMQVARANFAGNGITGIKVVRDLQTVRRRFDLIVANILAKTFLEIRKDLDARLRRGGHLILSGLLHRDVKAVLTGFPDYRLLERKNHGGWSALWLKKKG